MGAAAAPGCACAGRAGMGVVRSQSGTPPRPPRPGSQASRRHTRARAARAARCLRLACAAHPVARDESWPNLNQAAAAAGLHRGQRSEQRAQPDNTRRIVPTSKTKAALMPARPARPAPWAVPGQSAPAAPRVHRHHRHRGVGPPRGFNASTLSASRRATGTALRLLLGFAGPRATCSRLGRGGVGPGHHLLLALFALRGCPPAPTANSGPAIKLYSEIGRQAGGLADVGLELVHTSRGSGRGGAGRTCPAENACLRCSRCGRHCAARSARSGHKTIAHQLIQQLQSNFVPITRGRACDVP